eukprot:CAMPEP_0178757724 /NCGR_PEP_ID=MMETSP0744-20121128/13973_1 /TAXON_ID=913974 /ORGANISM="Nitzschia punctata, Strain CCMP561" /LENGTH=302 /DNA_ID=CAMNT_0020411977 /DNA_START=213 /DNA_END=1121 /DNA_ORIENTATION=+
MAMAFPGVLEEGQPRQQALTPAGTRYDTMLLPSCFQAEPFSGCSNSYNASSLNSSSSNSNAAATTTLDFFVSSNLGSGPLDVPTAHQQTNIEADDPSSTKPHAISKTMTGDTTDPLYDIAGGAGGDVSGAVCIPSRNDVLFGRGKGFQNHIGNQLYRQLIEDCLPTYETSNKEQKTRIAQEIVSIVHEANGRFLKDDGATGWVPVTDLQLLRKKVSHAFRGLRSQKKTQSSQASKAAARRRPFQETTAEGSSEEDNITKSSRNNDNYFDVSANTNSTSTSNPGSTVEEALKHFHKKAKNDYS